MHANGRLIYKCGQMEKHVTIYTIHKIYKCIWIKTHYGNSGVTGFIILLKTGVHMDVLQMDL